MLARAKLPGADFSHDDLSRIDLTGANLHLSDLSGANLRRAHLFRANLGRCDLREAILTGASLVRADLTGSCLRGANLRGADLSHADLSRADLEEANLTGANLTGARLSWATLSGAMLRNARLNGAFLDMADLRGAELRGAAFIRVALDDALLDSALLEMTIFADCDLSRAIGLEGARHAGPSVIGADSLGRSRGLIPVPFLRGAGVAEALIASQPRLRSARRADARVLLIGSVKDAPFIHRAMADLRKSGALCWSLFVDDEGAFQSREATLDRAAYYDRLALVCSVNSLENPFGSRFFAELARDIPEASGRSLLPLAIDDHLYRSGEKLCADLRSLDSVDWRGWEEREAYRRGLAALEAALS